jgi:hypothetical protein
VVTAQKLAASGYRPTNKGRFGLFVNAMVPPDLGITVRTTAVRGTHDFDQDLLICPQDADPVAALDRIILVCLRPLRHNAPPDEEDREIVDVVYLAPPRIAIHALRRDVDLFTDRDSDSPNEERLGQRHQTIKEALAGTVQRP